MEGRITSEELVQSLIERNNGEQGACTDFNWMVESRARSLYRVKLEGRITSEELVQILIQDCNFCVISVFCSGELRRFKDINHCIGFFFLCRVKI